MRLSSFFSIRIAAAVFALLLFSPVARALDDSWLELSFAPPAGWKSVQPDKLMFSLMEFPPAYVYQKGDSVIFFLYQQKEGLSLQNASQWMHDSASEIGKVSELDYQDVNGRKVSRFLVRGKGKDIGSTPALASKQIDNLIVTATNGEWLIRIIYSSPKYDTYASDFEAFLSSIVFKGAEDPSDSMAVNVPPDVEDIPDSSRLAKKNCKTESSLKIQIPKNDASTVNAETNLKIFIEEISELRISLNGQEIAILSDPENPVYKTIPLEKGQNTVKLSGIGTCGGTFTDSIKITREEK